MSLGRRKVKLEDAAAWVFNRMADVYDARPPYPVSLLHALAQLAGAPGARVVDLGAGIGHVALPLAARGYSVDAIEPALAMLEHMQLEATRCGLSLRTHHAQAEAVPVADESVQLVVIADALHFLDAELTGREVARLLAPAGALALVTVQFSDTPFMRALSALMEEAAPRRPRAIGGNMAQLAAVAGITLSVERELSDSTPVDSARLERIVRSISFIGPAMNQARFAAFRAKLLALPAPVWSRKFTLHAGRRSSLAAP